MTMVKSLWAMVQDDPVFMRRANGWLTVFWIAMIPISIATKWVESVVYVSALSLWALVSGHWAAWQAARVEVNQREEEKEARSHDVPEEVVARIVEETEIERMRTSREGGTVTERDVTTQVRHADVKHADVKPADRPAPDDD